MSKIQYFTTKKIKEILNNYATRSDIGTDFEEIRAELQDELWKRQERANEKLISQSLKRYNHVMEG